MTEVGERPKRRWHSLVEVAAFYICLEGFIWADQYRPPAPIIVLILLALCIFSSRMHRDSLERIGLASANFKPAFALATKICIPFLVPAYAIVAYRGFRGEWNLWFSFLGYPIWAFVQEYALLGFVANRLEEAISSRAWIPWLNGLLFASAHLPNPVLTIATFISGTLFTALFFKRRHLVPAAVFHALFGVAICMAFNNFPGIMSVGPGYLRRFQ